MVGVLSPNMKNIAGALLQPFFLPLGHKLKLNSLEGNFRAGVVEMIHAAESAGNIK